MEKGRKRERGRVDKKGKEKVGRVEEREGMRRRRKKKK